MLLSAEKKRREIKIRNSLGGGKRKYSQGKKGPRILQKGDGIPGEQCKRPSKYEQSLETLGKGEKKKINLSSCWRGDSWKIEERRPWVKGQNPHPEWWRNFENRHQKGL